MIKLSNFNKNYIFFILALLLALPGLRYLLKPGFFPMHDDTQVARVSVMAKALSQGQFPVRIVDGLGYGFGYPIFNFYNPLPYYFGGLCNLFGFSALNATKLMIAVGFLLAGAGIFLLVNNYLGKLSALTASLIYIYSPYHAIQIFVRGSIAELWAYGLLPFVLYFFVKRKTILGGIFLALVILSHNITAILTLVLIALTTLILCFLRSKKERIRVLFNSSKIIFLGLVLSAFFWLPAFLEKKLTQVDSMVHDKFNPLLHFVYPGQFWTSAWGYGGSAPGLNDGMSFQLGKIQIIVALLSIPLYFLTKKYFSKILNIVFIIVWILFISSLLAMLPVSAILWAGFYRQLSYIQFPWRFLTFADLGLAFLSGFSVYMLGKIKPGIIKKISFIIILVAILIVNLKYFVPQYTFPAQDSDFLKKDKISWVTSAISDEYLPIGFPKPKFIEEISDGKFSLTQKGEIIENRITSSVYLLTVNTDKENILKINTAYFPGWKAWLDGKNIKITVQNYLMAIQVPKGNHRIKIAFTNTNIRLISDIISLTALMLIILWKLKLRFT